MAAYFCGGQRCFDLNKLSAPLHPALSASPSLYLLISCILRRQPVPHSFAVCVLWRRMFHSFFFLFSEWTGLLCLEQEALPGRLARMTTRRSCELVLSFFCSCSACLAILVPECARRVVYASTCMDCIRLWTGRGGSEKVLEKNEPNNMKARFSVRHCLPPSEWSLFSPPFFFILFSACQAMVLQCLALSSLFLEFFLVSPFYMCRWIPFFRDHKSSISYGKRFSSSPCIAHHCHSTANHSC